MDCPAAVDAVLIVRADHGIIMAALSRLSIFLRLITLLLCRGEPITIQIDQRTADKAAFCSVCPGLHTGIDCDNNSKAYQYRKNNSNNRLGHGIFSFCCLPHTYNLSI